MKPKLIEYSGCPWPLLIPGIHDATMAEVYDWFVTNHHRKGLYEGLTRGLGNLFLSGCPQVFLDGSYVTGKPHPNDYEVCWDGAFVNPNLLDPVFFDFSDLRAEQKKKYYGEYFPAYTIERKTGKPFLEFFQIDKETGRTKGIIRIVNYIKRRAI